MVSWPRFSASTASTDNAPPGVADIYTDLDTTRLEQVESEASLRNWVAAARRAGLSWEDIGATLGVTRQAAQKRFAPSEPPLGAGGPGERLVRTGVTAFNEVEVLRREGLLGHRLVGGGLAKLYFEQTDRAWEHVRVVSLRRGKPIAEMEAEGWTHVFSWYPYTYFARPAGSAG